MYAAPPTGGVEELGGTALRVGGGADLVIHLTNGEFNGSAGRPAPGPPLGPGRPMLIHRETEAIAEEVPGSFHVTRDHAYMVNPCKCHPSHLFMMLMGHIISTQGAEVILGPDESSGYPNISFLTSSMRARCLVSRSGNGSPFSRMPPVKLGGRFSTEACLPSSPSVVIWVRREFISV